jgi:hypothetical protein
MVEVIVIEMTEDQDQIEDLMAVVTVIEEETLIEDQDLMIGIMTEDLQPIINTDLDLDREMEVLENHTTKEETTEVLVITSETIIMQTEDKTTVKKEVEIEDPIQEVMTETTKLLQEAEWDIMNPENTENQENSDLDMKTEETTDAEAAVIENSMTEVEEVEVVSMMKDRESLEMVYASFANKKVTKPWIALINHKVTETTEEVEVETEEDSDTEVAEETLEMTEEIEVTEAVEVTEVKEATEKTEATEETEATETAKEVHLCVKDLHQEETIEK